MYHTFKINQNPEACPNCGEAFSRLNTYKNGPLWKLGYNEYTHSCDDCNIMLYVNTADTKADSLLDIKEKMGRLWGREKKCLYCDKPFFADSPKIEHLCSPECLHEYLIW